MQEERVAHNPMMRGKSDFRFLFLSLIGMSLLGPLLGPIFYKYGILELTFTTVMLSVILRCGRGKAHIGVSLVLGSAALVSMLAGRLTDADPLPMSQSLMIAAFLGYTAYLVLSNILSTKGVTSHEVFGALSVYLLLGMTWEFFYAVCLQADPGAISFPEGPVSLSLGPAQEGSSMQSLSYFSFVTLTTLGYGDILPVSRMARTLAWMEAVFGQLFLAVLVARLVGLMGIQSQHKENS